MKSASTVIPFRTSIKPPTISQIDLVEERLLSEQLDETIRRLQQKRDEIRAALEAGATILGGPHFAYLKPVALPDGSKYSELVVG
jgi:hypothetical protein